MHGAGESLWVRSKADRARPQAHRNRLCVNWPEDPPHSPSMCCSWGWWSVHTRRRTSLLPGHRRRGERPVSWPRTSDRRLGRCALQAVRPTHAVLRPGVRWETWMWMLIAFGTLSGVGVNQGWSLLVRARCRHLLGWHDEGPAGLHREYIDLAAVAGAVARVPRPVAGTSRQRTARQPSSSRSRSHSSPFASGLRRVVRHSHSAAACAQPVQPHPQPVGSKAR